MRQSLELVKKAIRDGIIYYVSWSNSGRRLVEYREGKWYIDGAHHAEETVEACILYHSNQHPEDFREDIIYLEEKYVV
jgi:hypothetical protein